MQAPLWIIFIVFILAFMAVDLLVVGRKKKAISIKLALGMTGLSITVALCFVPIIYYVYGQHLFGMGMAKSPEGASIVTLSGRDAALRFLQGWILEYAMSVDNIFVFAIIFRHFAVPKEFQHRVLTWGIVATLIMRGAMIGGAMVVLDYMSWLIYIAGAFLVVTAWKLAFAGDDHFDPKTSKAISLVRRFIPVTSEYSGERFFVRDPANSAKRSATPLFLVLMVLNVVDLVFAIDSVPAVIAVTTDPFLVFSSNMLAILGLRALYFVLASAMDKFRFLNLSLAAVLGFVGVKMLAEGVHHLHKLEKIVPHRFVDWLPDRPIEMAPAWSLAVILTMLIVGIVASLLFPPKPGHEDGGHSA
jgi:tellurite resistance protein TerC